MPEGMLEVREEEVKFLKKFVHDQIEGLKYVRTVLFEHLCTPKLVSDPEQDMRTKAAMIKVDETIIRMEEIK